MTKNMQQADAATAKTTASKTQEDLYAIIESLKSVTVPLIIDACNFYNKTNVLLVKNNYKPSLTSFDKDFASIISSIKPSRYFSTKHFGHEGKLGL